MLHKITYKFSASIWQLDGPGGWFFVSLPEELSTEIRTHIGSQEECWGRLKAQAQVRNTKWDTAIWFDTKKKTYLLPLKADVRKKEKLETGDTIEVALWL